MTDTRRQDILDWVGEKPILIVGNGERYSWKNGCVVVRMNWGATQPCDIWIDNITWTHAGRNILPVEYKWRVHTVKRKPTGINLTKEEGRDMAKALPEHPSTGLMTIWLMKRWFPENEVFITGYNGKTNRYTGKKMMGPHDFREERKVMGDWVESGWIKTLEDKV